MILLMAKNIGPGDAVFTTNFSFFATTEVISILGATPVFVDIDESTFNIDSKHLENQIKKVIETGELNPKAIISVDLFGLLADYDNIEAISKKYQLFLIEDAAQSFGATYNGKKACSFGDASATSFYPAKPLGCYGDGGAIFTDNDDLATICKSIRVHGEGKDKYHNIQIGLNSRLDTIQAAVLLNKIKIFDNELQRRNQIANEYSNKMPKDIITPHIPNGFVSSWAQYSILCNNEHERDDIIKLLNNEEIPCAVFYRVPFSENSVYKSMIQESFPISESISKRILSLPMHPYLDLDDINKITSIIDSYFN